MGTEAYGKLKHGNLRPRNGSGTEHFRPCDDFGTLASPTGSTTTVARRPCRLPPSPLVPLLTLYPSTLSVAPPRALCRHLACRPPSPADATKARPSIPVSSRLARRLLPLASRPPVRILVFCLGHHLLFFLGVLESFSYVSLSLFCLRSCALFSACPPSS